MKCIGRPSRNAPGPGGAKSDGPLKLAVPRGALFDETLDILDAAGVDTAALRGDSRSLGGAAVERATARIGETFEALEARGVADRVRIDLGLLRDLGYYSGAILEVYDPALGHVLGGGGRYDGLLKRFGVDLPAAGFALYLERVHVAQMEESRGREST